MSDIEHNATRHRDAAPFGRADGRHQEGSLDHPATNLSINVRPNSCATSAAAIPP
jgi:hypothetical protein